MYFDGKIWMGSADGKPVCLLPSMANRHGLISGATGTGKTITLKVMAESFSDAGVPVFVSDIKGDLTGMISPGEDTERMQKLIEKYRLKEVWSYKSYPTAFWDVFGEKGTPVRATVSEMGPMLLSRIMGLTPVQEGVLHIVFNIADDQGLLLLDLKDLRSMLREVGDHAAEYKTRYGNITAASVGAIQRGLLKLEDQGAEEFFGEPSLDISDWLVQSEDGRGMINVMNCERLFLQPELYATFLLWMLSELYEYLPEVGDLAMPKAVFFFDEAHLLFNLKSKDLLAKVEQVVRLIRSKGVGVYFITQSPTDVPNTVLAQLGNRIQHALRAYTPADQKGLRAAAASFRTNPAFDTAEAITSCGTGEAVVSFMDEKGAPSMVERCGILPPQSLMGPADEVLLAGTIAMSEMGKKYNTPVDRESAHELLAEKFSAEEEAKEAAAAEKARLKEEKEKEKERAAAVRQAKAELREEQKKEKNKREIEKSLRSIATSAGRTATNKLIRGLLGSLLKR